MQDGAEPFGLGAMCEVWASRTTPRTTTRCSTSGSPPASRDGSAGPSGYDLHVEHGLDAAADADLVCRAQARLPRPSPEVRRPWPRDDRGAIVFAHCSGAFVLGEAGLLDGRECTTHWRYADQLAERFPEAMVDPTSSTSRTAPSSPAPSAAGPGRRAAPDAPAVRRPVAATAARRMVVPPHRDGGQAQFIARAVPDCDAETLGPLLTWIIENLGEDLSVEELARKRTCRPHLRPPVPRRDRHHPAPWVDPSGSRPPRRLATTDHSIDWIADEVGFGNAATLRHHFTRHEGSARRPASHRCGEAGTRPWAAWASTGPATLPVEGARQLVEEVGARGACGGASRSAAPAELGLGGLPDDGRSADPLAPLVVGQPATSTSRRRVLGTCSTSSG